MEIKNAIALAAAVLITFAAVAALQTIWGDTISQNRTAHQQQLLRETLFEVDYETIEKFSGTEEIKPSQMRVQQWWRAMGNDKTQAIVVQAVARGYGGDIIFLMSFNRQGQRLRTRILRHRETPGIADFLSEPHGGDRAIDGVSGATITSNALAKSARQIIQWIRYNSEMLFVDSASIKRTG